MADGEKHRDSQVESTKTPKRPKDLWDKADVLIKFLAAALIAAFGFFGNQYLQEKQKIDSDIKLYTEIMSNKERAENSLRKDMFGEMLKSFLQPKDAKDKSQQDTLSRIREMRLSLDLLSRNFHESLDMKPLFNHLLMEIIRPMIKLRKGLEAQESMEDISKGQSEDLKKQDNDMLNPAIELANQKNTTKEQAISLKKSYERERDLLIRVARRVTRKQSEILEEVSGKITLEIPLKGQPEKKICTKYKPRSWLPEDDGTCGETKNGEPVMVEGVSVEKNLSFKGSDQQALLSSSRYFRVKVRYVYPRWKQIYVEILTCPKQEKCEEKPKSDPEKDTASFWVGYFDFPLVDHSYLNEKQRYSVKLNKFKEDQDGNDEKAELTLLYYPSSYAGLKEKSFYNIQLMRGLLKSKLFSDQK